MKRKFPIIIGMRKIKSLIAIAITFIVWQILRLFLPQLEPHPIFAYIYALIEMRDTAEKTQKFGGLRIKATFVGLLVGLLFVFFITQTSPYLTGAQMIYAEFGFVLIASLVSLCVAEAVKCETFCGIAAIITIICMVSHSGEDTYLYAIMRVVQTLLGVFAAWLVNKYIHSKKRAGKKKGTGNTFIVGDSYSTFKGYIPDGYEFYYHGDIPEYELVNCVENTWWHKFIQKTDGTLVLNDSFSGSTICNTRYEKEYCPHTSFIGRIDRYIKEGFFDKNKIDTLFVFGGTNDSWADSPIGKLTYDDFTDDNLRKALPAFCYLLDTLTKKLKGVRVVVILNDGLKYEIISNYIQACEHFGVEYVKLTEIDKTNGHPTVTGMAQIAEQVEKAL